MPGLTVVVHHDGSSVDRTQLAALHAAAAVPRVGTRMWTGVGFGAAWDQPDPTGPTPWGADSGTVVAGDVRLDHPDELRARLAGAPSADHDEVGLVAHILAQLGEAGIEELHGDYAVVAWDVEASAGWLWRDALGTRPLYWYDDGQVTVAATEVASILAHPRVRREPNIRGMASLLFLGSGSYADTLYLGIHRAPPGHRVEIGVRRTPKAHRYWRPDTRNADQDLTLEACTEEFLTLLTRAVRARTNRGDLIVADTSGGLDSSLVTTIAALSRPDLRAGTITYPGLAADESALARQVVEAANVEWLPVPWQPRPFDRMLDGWLDRTFLPDPPNSGFDLALTDIAAGADVVELTGHGGDEIGTGLSGYPTWLLRTGRLAEAAAIGGLQPGHLARHLLNRLRAPVRRRLRPSADGEGWLGPRLRPLAWESAGRSDGRAATPAQLRAEFFTRPHLVGAYEWLAASTRARRIEQRHPFLDRELVDWAVAVPERLRWTSDDNRTFQRAAGRNLLPTAVVDARSKPDFDEVFGIELRRWMDEHPHQIKQATTALCEEGITKDEAFGAVLDVTAGGGRAAGRTAYPSNVWAMVALGLWLSEQ